MVSNANFSLFFDTTSIINTKNSFTAIRVPSFLLLPTFKTILSRKSGSKNLGTLKKKQAIKELEQKSYKVWKATCCPCRLFWNF